MILDLCYWDDPILRKKCRPVEKITDEIKTLIKDMIETMDAKKGVGLAAPQVGVDLCLFVMRNTEEGPEGELVLTNPQVYINPKITDPSKELEVMSEGCLSLPGLHLDIARPYSITVRALDENGNSFTENLEGYKARVIMHENDHINGKLFFDRISSKLRKKIEPELQRIKKEYGK